MSLPTVARPFRTASRKELLSHNVLCILAWATPMGELPNSNSLDMYVDLYEYEQEERTTYNHSCVQSLTN